jgi:Leucine-rich repeat (LRR) protein
MYHNYGKHTEKVIKQLQNYKENKQTELDFNNYEINILPYPLPKNLVALRCSNTNIEFLCSGPIGLEIIECRNTPNLRKIFDLPDTVFKLDCSKSGLEYIGELPNELRSLVCTNTNIKNLPHLPNSLEFLNCSTNEIHSIENLPKSLEVLNISKTRISELPELPIYLNSLDCSNTEIKELPALPNCLTDLDIHNTKIEKLPILPFWLTKLNIINTQIKRLPNIPKNITTVTCSHKFMTEAFEQLPKTLTKFACICETKRNDPECFECHYKKVSYNKIISYSEAYLVWKEAQSKERIISRTRQFNRDLFDAVFVKSEVFTGS